MTHDEIEALAQRFVTAVETGDVDTAREIYSPDAVIWHNHDQLEQGRDANIATLGWMHRTLPDRKYTDIKRTVFDGGFVQQHVLRAAAPGGPFVLHAILQVACADGRITRLDEYFDSAQLRALERP